MIAHPAKFDTTSPRGGAGSFRQRIIMIAFYTRQRFDSAIQADYYAYTREVLILLFFYKPDVDGVHALGVFHIYA